MGKLEDTLAQGVKDGKVPHVVVFATNRDGSFTYKHAVGQSILGDETLIKEDAVFMLASQTKFLTTIAALQIVERGLWGLDDDVASKLPELAEQPILKGFDDNDKPILEKRKNTITLRHLLTHSSGTAYDAGDPNLMRWTQQKGKIPNTAATIQDRFGYPLIFEPGTQFMYGTGMDWAAKLVERITEQNLEEYEKKNMWQPLGITGITFWPYKNSELKDKVPGLTQRTPQGQLVLFSEPSINDGSIDCFGGHGAYAKMADFMKVQRSILANDGKLLKPETVKMMFTPQLTPEGKESLKHFLHSPWASMMPGAVNAELECDWGFGGILHVEGDEGRRKSGSLNWSGMANCWWIIDPEADLALTFGTQVLPSGDKGVEEMISAVEFGVYEMACVKF